jgi:MFS family permease
LAFEIYEPPSQALVADTTPAAQHARAYGLLAAAMAAAGMGSGLLAAWVAGAGLRWLFVVDAATCLACAAAVALVLPPRPRMPVTRSTVARSWTDTRLLALLAAGVGFAVIYLQISVALPLTLAARGLGAADLGLLLTVSAATIVAVQPLLNRLGPLVRADHHRAMALGYVLLAAGLLGYAQARGLPFFVAATVVWSLGDAILMGHAYAVVASVAPDGARGRYLATYGLSWGIAAVGAPLVGTQLITHLGVSGTWTCIAGLGAVLALVQPALRRHLRRDPGPAAVTTSA